MRDIDQKATRRTGSTIAKTSLKRRTVLGAASLLACPAIVRAQASQGTDWPNQPVKFINIFPPGGATDNVSRLWCAKMAEITGQPFVVDNRAGAGGTIGADVIAKARPDGYTLGLGSIAAHAIGPSLYAKLPFDAGKDFTWISAQWRLPNLVVVNNDLPVRTVPELIALFKANPGKYSYGSSGVGTTLHLAGEMLKQMTGVDILHVPYRGGAPALMGLMAGDVHVIMDNMPGLLPAARDGRVRPLAVTSLQRSPFAPELPAMNDFVPGFEITAWGAAVGPANMPRAVVDKCSAASRQALQSPELVAAFAKLGATAWWTPPAEIAAFRAREEARLAPIIRASGARVE